MLERWGQKRWRSRRWLKSVCILLKWVMCLDKRQDERAVRARLSERKSMRWGDRWRHSTKYLRKREFHRSWVAQWDRFVGGQLILREEGWCKRVEQHRQESAVIACGGTTNRWEGRDVLWFVCSWGRLSQRTISHIINSGLRRYCKCWLIRGCFLRARLVKYSRRCWRLRTE